MSCSERQGRDLSTWERLDIVEEQRDSNHEGIDDGVLVIARDVIMELLPKPLDGIGLGRVGRQEVQDDAAAQGPRGIVASYVTCE